MLIILIILIILRIIVILINNNNSSNTFANNSSNTYNNNSSNTYGNNSSNTYNNNSSNIYNNNTCNTYNNNNNNNTCNTYNNNTCNTYNKNNNTCNTYNKNNNTCNTIRLIFFFLGNSYTFYPCLILRMKYLDVIMNQATINLGMIGHVAHGKTVLVNRLTSIDTSRFKDEKERRITMKLGYANCKIYECASCKRPNKYKSFGSHIMKSVLKCMNEGCQDYLYLKKHVSFIDCPGHEVLMTTMLTGTAIMDGAVLLVAADQHCPQPQTLEHLFAVEVMGLEHIIIVQNKLDLVPKEKAIEHKEQIDEFLSGMKIKDCPVVPASAQLTVNIDAVLDFIVNYIPEPARYQKLEKYIDFKPMSHEDYRRYDEQHIDLKKSAIKEKTKSQRKREKRKSKKEKERNNSDNDTNDNTIHSNSDVESQSTEDIKKFNLVNTKNTQDLTGSAISTTLLTQKFEKMALLTQPRNKEDYPSMVIIRSFSINKPGTKPENWQGGVIGGTLTQGILKLGDIIEIRPGKVYKRSDGKSICRPFLSTVLSLKTEQNFLNFGITGGLIGVGTNLDPHVARGDKLVGQIMGIKGYLPKIYCELDIQYTLFKKIAIAEKNISTSVDDIEEDESLTLSIGSMTTGCTVSDVFDSNEIRCVLVEPVCCEIGVKIALSRRFGEHWRLIGCGKVIDGNTIDPVYDDDDLK
ncbi:small GTP-binding protein domain [Edhazardia aedis USNM 41457]|uniref:Eukaryotic translation initiation factor 2 subunit gamma n=1 Tax=Edhazardia aedis (strain USNM 41457) TaxID=1003232 RepID=J9DLJ3_EDHAE|nr:small GTP-binding protein domain [Edhazardia aedis USNM 41457]|eukprot:EJW03460.1 small GTP-binding protein domain [Edhazardia aedis USNM 41457]